MEIKEIIKLCEEYFQRAPKQVVRLAGAGSSRRYYRVLFTADGASGQLSEGEDRHARSVIATAGDDLRENRAFCRLSEIFGEAVDSAVVHIPKVYCHSSDYSIYLQEDFGDTSLLDIIRKEGAPEEIVKRVLDGLLQIQCLPEREWQEAIYAGEFGCRRVMGDLNYFKYCFLKVAGIAFDEDALDHEFERIASIVGNCDGKLIGFMYRDFQSRNILISAGCPVFIDYQGGMKGPMVYDAVSLLWQAKAGFSDEFRRRMLDYYIKRLCTLRHAEEDEVRNVAHRLILLRTLQVLGAYGFRGLIEKKAHFIESIPGALHNLKSIVESGFTDDYPELKRCCESLVRMPRFLPSEHTSLRVEILSFSFKKGYPENLTGNGGGFVFDCRGMHNPGRYEEYKILTGNDAPVIQFLEERGEVQVFMQHVGELICPVVDTYLRRGFRDLQVAFGCTGGRHRSVYCANALAKMLRSRYAALDIRLIHREQGIDLQY